MGFYLQTEVEDAFRRVPLIGTGVAGEGSYACMVNALAAICCREFAVQFTCEQGHLHPTLSSRV